jgi:hypothetical protein
LDLNDNQTILSFMQKHAALHRIAAAQQAQDQPAMIYFTSTS